MKKDTKTPKSNEEKALMETLAFHKKLILDEVSKEWKRDSGILQVKRAHLE